MKTCSLEGHFCLRERLAISILFQRSIKITNIRSFSSNPGVKNFEIFLFSLIDKIIPGSIFKINENGTTLKFIPGNHLQSKTIHQIGSFRSLSYYLEFILYISNLKGDGIEIKLSGLRSCTLDVSMESMLYVTIPLHRKLGSRDTRIKIFSNSFSLIRNTELILVCPKMNCKINCAILEPGILRKIRVVFSNCSSPNFSRELNSCLLEKNSLLGKIDFSFFNFKIPSKTFRFQSLTVIGETSTGCIFGNDFSTNKKNLEFINWKIFLNQVLNSFFEDVKTGTCVDKRNQVFLLLKFFQKQNKRLKLRIGKLTLSTVFFFRDVRRLTGMIYKINSSLDKKSLILTLN